MANAWFLATVLVAGLAVGSLGVLLLGRLLGRNWLTPIDDELEPAALTLPLVTLLALPLAFDVDVLLGAPGAARSGDAVASWFAPTAWAARALGYLAVWSLVALWVRGRDEAARPSAIGLAILLPTLSLAGVDWILGRGPFWWSGILGFAFAVGQLAPALALAFLANAAQREHVERLHDRSLHAALLTLALATLGLWYLQFLTAWMGNLPAAAAWYQARLVDGRALPLVFAAAMLVVAIALLLVRVDRVRWPAVLAALLILAQHALHTAWLLRPAGTPSASAVAAGTAALVFVAWGGAYAALLARRKRRDAAQGRAPRTAAAAQSGRFGSS